MKNCFYLAITLFSLSSCNEDSLWELNDFNGLKNQQTDIIWLDQSIKHDNTPLDTIAWSDLSCNKSYSVYDYSFIDGGMALIAGQFLPTVIIGDQRWTTMDYKGVLHDTSLSDWDNKLYGVATAADSTVYYSYNLAMTLNNTATTFNLYSPTGLVEESNWRIPSTTDDNHLYHLANGNETLINTWLNPLRRGMIYHSYSSFNLTEADTIPCVFAANEAIYWLSEYLDPVVEESGAVLGPYGTWHLSAMNGTDHVYMFQFQYMMPYAPIRLVQDIRPIE